VANVPTCPHMASPIPMSNTPGDYFAESPMPSFATVEAPVTKPQEVIHPASQPIPPPVPDAAPPVPVADQSGTTRDFIARASHSPGTQTEQAGRPDPPAPPPPPPPAVNSWPMEHPVSILQKRWAQATISLGTSLALHVVVIVLGLLTYKAAVQFVQKEEEQIIVPSSDLALDGTPGGSLHPGLGDDPNRDSGQDAVRDVPADHTGWADRPGDSLADVLEGGGSGNDSAATAIAMGLTGRGIGSLSGGGSGDTTGIGGTGQIAPWGPPGGGNGLGPKTNFLGSGGNALSVTYICDASGSMDTKFDLLKRKLEESIDRLQPIQQFNVIFFNDDKTFPLSSTFLLQAQAANKSRAYRFIDDMYVHAGSDPLNAITAAFSQRPQLIYFLTDGEFPNDDAIIKKIATLNSRGTTKINTILLMGKRSEETGMTTFVKVMKRIAADNGGIFSSLSVEDF